MPNAKVGATQSVTSEATETRLHQSTTVTGTTGHVKETCGGRAARVARVSLNWTPIVFVTGILIYGYYVYVVEYCFLTLLEYDPPQTVKAVLYLVTINFLVLLFGTSYIRTIIQSPGSPLDYNLQIAEEGASTEILGWRSPKATMSLAQSPKAPPGPLQASSPNYLPISAAPSATLRPPSRMYVLPTHPGRYCGICNTPKPPRCHHCSECARCILKMDHHCPWFNNCVGWGNYKFFWLSLTHGLILCIFIFTTLLQELIWELAHSETRGRSVQFLVIAIFSLILGISAGSLLIYHMFLVAVNRTTLEQFDRHDSERRRQSHDQEIVNYDVGLGANLLQVFGRRWYLWLLPIYTDKDKEQCDYGLHFPTRLPEMREQV